MVRPRNPDKIIIIFYVLSRNLMSVVKLKCRSDNEHYARFRSEGATGLSPGFNPWEPPFPERRALKGRQIEPT
jgi:hypothetical protein